MEFKATLYKKPIMVGTIFILAGIFISIFGVYLASVSEYPDAGYASVVFGILFIISGVTTLLVYGAMERKFRKTMRNTLLCYSLDPIQYAQSAQANVDEIKTSNKAALLIMLFFCGVVVVMGLVIGEDGMLLSLIGIILAVFLTAAKIIITKYRGNKIKKGSRLVALSIDGAFIGGEFHCWNTPASRLISIGFYEEPSGNGISGNIIIDYSAAALPAVRTIRCILPISFSYVDQAKWAVQQFNGRYPFSGQAVGS